MKICWDNLEKLEYKPHIGEWRDKEHKSNYWIYKEFCLQCNNPFLCQRNPKRQYLFCSKNCQYFSTPKIRPENIRKNISKGLKGRKLSQQHKENIGKASSLRKHSEKTKRKLSILHSGEKNPAWKGGIACEPYCDVWLDKKYKESIKERDGYKCLNPDCNKNSNRLCLHHINYNKKDCRPKNLITICNSCNLRANKDRIWHEVWYNTIIYRRYGI